MVVFGQMSRHPHIFRGKKKEKFISRIGSELRTILTIIPCSPTWANTTTYCSIWRFKCGHKKPFESSEHVQAHLKSLTKRPHQMRLLRSFMMGQARKSICCHSGMKIIWPLMCRVLSTSWIKEPGNSVLSLLSRPVLATRRTSQANLIPF